MNQVYLDYPLFITSPGSYYHWLRGVRGNISDSSVLLYFPTSTALLTDKGITFEKFYNFFLILEDCGFSFVCKISAFFSLTAFML